MTAWPGARGLVCRARRACASLPEKGQSPGRGGCPRRAPQTHGDVCPPSVRHSWGQSWTRQSSALGTPGLQGPVYPAGRSPPGSVPPLLRECPRLNTHIRPPRMCRERCREAGGSPQLPQGVPHYFSEPCHQESVPLGPHTPDFSWLSGWCGSRPRRAGGDPGRPPGGSDYPEI